MKTKLIKVTQKDIELGKRTEPRSCPVGRAIRRAFKKGESFYGVGDGVSNTIEFYGGRYTANSPFSVKRFYSKFDTGKSVKPFEFTLRYKKCAETY